MTYASMQQLIHDLRVHQIELEQQNNELRRIQAELDSAQARYFDFYDMAPVGYVCVDGDDRILQANLTTATLLGLDRSRLANQKVSRFIYKEDQDIYYLLRKQALACVLPHSCELRLRHSDGSAFWVRLLAIVVKSDEGIPVLRIVLSDIAERKQAEAALLENRKFRDAILDSVTSQIAVLDRSGTIVAVNQPWRRFARDNSVEPGATANHTDIGVNYIDICQATCGDASATAIQARDGILKVIAGDLPSFYLEYPCHSPTQQRWFDLRVTPLYLDGHGVVVTHTEATDRKQLQSAQLALAVEEKLATSRQQLRELVALNEATREQERKYIAREVHDELGQVLTALRMDMSLLGMRYGEQDPALLAEVQGMKVLADRAIQGVRDVATRLRPTALDMGLVPAIEWLCLEFSRVNHLPCVFNTQGYLNLDDARAVVIFRIAQESLTNITRYAKASSVGVNLGHHGQELRLEVSDNGCGFDVNAIRQDRSFGLLGMRERAISLGGGLEVTSAPGQGTVVALNIPFPVVEERGQA